MADFTVVKAVKKKEVPAAVQTHGPRPEYQDLYKQIMKDDKAGNATVVQVTDRKVANRIREGMRAFFRKKGYSLTAVKNLDHGKLFLYFTITPVPETDEKKMLPLGKRKSAPVEDEEEEEEEEEEDTEEEETEDDDEDEEDDEEDEEPAPPPRKKKR